MMSTKIEWTQKLGDAVRCRIARLGLAQGLEEPDGRAAFRCFSYLPCLKGEHSSAARRNVRFVPIADVAMMIGDLGLQESLDARVVNARRCRHHVGRSSQAPDPPVDA